MPETPQKPRRAAVDPQQGRKGGRRTENGAEEDLQDKEIEWFYRVDLEGMGQLEAFEVRYVDWEGSTLPDGQLVLWGIGEHTVDRWVVNRYPRDWKLALGLPLGLRAGEAAAEG